VVGTLCFDFSVGGFPVNTRLKPRLKIFRPVNRSVLGQVIYIYVFAHAIALVQLGLRC
jgi:hypothetical protein